MSNSKVTTHNIFSNGTEFGFWTERNCDRCWKQSHPKKRDNGEEDPDYTKFVCSIERDMILQAAGLCQEVSQRSYDICNKYIDCPYRQLERPKPRHNYQKHGRKNPRQITLDADFSVPPN